MPNIFTEQTFRSTYKDDWRDSDNYSRILFNAGRALQARELTQMQTIIQEEIRKFANNIFQKDGVPVKAGGVSVNNNYQFIKIAVDTNNKFNDVAALKGVILTGATSNIKVKVYEAVAAEGSDPNTLYVQYLDNPNTTTQFATVDLAPKILPGEVLSNGSDINMTVQTTNTALNPAVGSGSNISVGESHFYVNGHFVFVPKQSIFLNKYLRYRTEDVGFKVVQDIVTVSDTDTLYDNQGAVPNRASPGADRFRIRLVLSKRSDIVKGDTFVYFCRVEAGVIVDQLTSTEGYNEVKNFVNRRIKEIHGDFIKKYWKMRVEPNGTNATSTLMLKIDPGLAYIDGRRVETITTRSIPIPKARDTVVREDEQIGIDYGNFYYWDSGVGMLDINVCESVNLYAGFDGADSVIGTANIRAIVEGTFSLRTDGYTYNRAPLYKAHLFNINRTNFNYTLRDVKSIKSNSNNNLINLVQAINNDGSILHEGNKRTLLIDTPLRRPKSFTDVTITFMKKYAFTAAGSTHDITLVDAGETFVRENDILIASQDEMAPSGVSGDIQPLNKTVRFSGLTIGKGYEVIVFVRKTNAGVKTKTLTETTVTTTMDSDGNGIKYINLGKSDIYEVSRVRTEDSDGEDVFNNWLFDPGSRETHYDDGRLLWTTGGLDSEHQPVFVRFKYFEHSTSGEFFAVNSYDGQLDYLKIPAQKMKNGTKVSLRDVLDFRPATNGSGSFSGGTVCNLPEPTDTIQSTAEYYLPRNDKLVISKDGELRYILGSSSLNPKFPDVPDDCIDLYKVKLNPNTMHSQDLETTLIPRKGYTMADISKLEEKIDRLEEMTTLSLLELNTKFLKVLDSDGNERSKAGFFVDNFKSHQFSETQAPDYRAAIDKRGLLLRPSYVEDCIDLYYDSANVNQLRTVKKSDLVMLNYTEEPYQSQDLASNTENLAPFYNAQSVGRLTLSPETDAWFETEKVGETVVGTSSEFDLRRALNWNHSENEWFGIDPSNLEVGATNSYKSATSTTVVHNSQDTVLIGTESTKTLGEWVETGNVTDVEVVSTDVIEISREREEEISRSVIDADVYPGDHWIGTFTGEFVNYSNGYYDPWSGIWYGYNDGPRKIINYDLVEISTDMYDVVTRETRSKVRTTNTTTYEATVTVNTENTYQGTAEVVTTTTTQNTVNRIASDSTIRDVVGNKIIDVSVIPFMRSIAINFKAEGLRPNTQYYPFFDNTNVGPYCREESSFVVKSDRDAVNANSNADDEGTQRTTQLHSKGTTSLISDAEGTIIGSFEVPNNASMRFPTGVREFSLLDVNAHNFSAALSFARANFISAGTLEKFEDEVRVTRILKVVGESFNTSERDVEVKKTVWTENIVETEIATDVKSTSTLSTIKGNTTTTREYVGSDATIESVFNNNITPINHVTETEEETTPPGGTTKTPAGSAGSGVPMFNDVIPNDIFWYQDPLAQTFVVTQTSGVFLTTVRVYFASKSTSAPVFCEIRPTENGIPSANKLLATKKLSPSQVSVVPSGSNNKQMLQNGTDFTFDEPLYLTRGEYAIVLRPANNNPDYNVYVANIGEHPLGSNQSIISQQPTMGAFFKSQNGKLWEPASDTDLAYKISVARFETSGNAILENVNVPPVSLSRDPLHSDSGSNLVRVMLKGHGLRDGDKTWIRGIDSATDFGNGLTGADVNGVRTVVGYDNSGYTYQATSSATKAKWFGGSSATSQRNINFEVLRPELNIIQPGQTDVTLSIKTATQQSLAGNETRFVKDSRYQIIENEKNNNYNSARAIYNRRTESLTGAGKLAGQRSATLQVNMKTTNPYVSPIIDLQRAKLNLIHNLISRQDSAATDGFNVPLTYVGEANPQFGTESAKHITNAVTLTEDAYGLKILLAANRPPEADFQVYYRLASEGDSIRRTFWTLVEPENTLQPDTNPNTYREYRYLVGGDGGTLKPFNQFQLKIVMRSTSSAKVPTFRDLRAIALAV